jgi:hypothetical protein
VPPGVSAREPKFVTREEIRRLGDGGNPAGVTDAQVALRFEDFANQWKRIEQRGRMPEWQFQGGNVFLDLTITVYVREDARKASRALALIMNHELWHVKDAIDEAKSSLTAALKKQPIIKGDLCDAKTVDEPSFNEWYGSAPGGVPAKLSTMVNESIWYKIISARNERRHHDDPNWVNTINEISHLL